MFNPAMLATTVPTPSMKTGRIAATAVSGSRGDIALFDWNGNESSSNVDVLGAALAFLTWAFEGGPGHAKVISACFDGVVIWKDPRFLYLRSQSGCKW